MFCSKCGYDLIGIRGKYCPECGTPVTPPVRDLLIEVVKNTAKPKYQSSLWWKILTRGAMALLLFMVLLWVFVFICNYM